MLVVTAESLYGDVNLDGKVDNKDATLLGRYLAKWEGYESLPIFEMKEGGLTEEEKKFF